MDTKLTKIKQHALPEKQADVCIDEFCKRLGLRILCRGRSDTLRITTFNINRPGLLLSGFNEYFPEGRIQVIGEQETAYIKTLPPSESIKAIDRLFQKKFPCVIVSSGIMPKKHIIDSAEKYGCVVLASDLRSTMIINEISIYLNELLAPEEAIHGGLMDIYGVGVLIIGKSSVGKSETALELLQRGHRLIADDAVCCKRVADRLVGACPGVIRYFLEVRGLGIIDVRSMYGAGSVLASKEIDLVIALEEWNIKKSYNRLGDEREVYNILGIELPMHTVPVKTGRNLAVILEAAARNYRLKSMGYDALGDLNERLENK
ncbi:MAG: HPr(Ser) kinase/phosphatase [Firmicutes bacterium]|nr:HPr(Ser) kinase/phosphatase [Bacillota bacterium]